MAHEEVVIIHHDHRSNVVASVPSDWRSVLCIGSLRMTNDSFLYRLSWLCCDFILLTVLLWSSLVSYHTSFCFMQRFIDKLSIPTSRFGTREKAGKAQTHLLCMYPVWVRNMFPALLQLVSNPKIRFLPFSTMT